VKAAEIGGRVKKITYLIPHRVHTVLDDLGSLLHSCRRHKK
jgi:hypothetical protein